MEEQTPPPLPVPTDHGDQQQKANAKAPIRFYEHQGLAWSEVRTRVLTIHWFLLHHDNIFGRCGGASVDLSSSALRQTPLPCPTKP